MTSRFALLSTTPVIALALVLGACGNDSDTTASDAVAAPESTTTTTGAPGPGSSDQVVIKTFIFRPTDNTVEAGTTVTWTNEDEILHTVTSGPRNEPDGVFDAQLDGAGSTFERTFDDPGTYEYVCSIHPGMDARIIVE